MRSIDIHAHISPEGYIRAVEAGEEWYGFSRLRRRFSPGGYTA